MTALKTPSPEASAEEWGRFAVSIPGWRDPDGDRFHLPDPDDWSWEGWLWRLAGFEPGATRPVPLTGLTLGRACIAAAAALGRWPGGEG